MAEHQFLWQIENFSACTEQTGDYLTSPVIRATDLDDSHWNIGLAPRGDSDDNFISVKFLRSSSDHGPTDLHIDLELCLVDLYGEDRFTVRSTCNCEPYTYLDFSEFAKRRDVFEDTDVLLPNDVLTLLIRARKLSDRDEPGAMRSVVHTKIHVEQSTFLWTIRRRSARKASANKRVVHFASGSFCMELACECDEQETPRDKHVLSLAIKPTDVPEVRIFMSAKMRVLDSNRRRQPHDSMEVERVFEAGSDDTWHLPRLHISDTTASVLEEGRLDLTCDFWISDGSHDMQTQGTSISLAHKSYSQNELQKDIGFVYENSLYVPPDIMLNVRYAMQYTWAHKFILSARSVVFREALDYFDMEKKRRLGLQWIDANIPATRNEACVPNEIVTVYGLNGMDCAQISHISPCILFQVIKCMYTDELDPINVINAMHLHAAGVILDFGLMREKSENYLKSKISLKNFHRILEYAHLSGIARLKGECFNFISSNRELILISDEWLLFRQVHRDLSQEVFEYFRA